jgi:hypothetical protein
MRLEADGVIMDFSRQRGTAETVAKLVELAKAADVRAPLK